MSSLLEVAFSQPASGWIGLRVTAPGFLYEDTFSHIYPVLEHLCGALCDAAAGVQSRRAIFLLEPAELELSFSPVDSEDARLTADVYPDHRRHPEARSSRAFELCAHRTALVLPFWRALRRLQTCLPAADFEREWREPFPEGAMASLSSIVKATPAEKGKSTTVHVLVSRGGRYRCRILERPGGLVEVRLQRWTEEVVPDVGKIAEFWADVSIPVILTDERTRAANLAYELLEQHDPADLR